MNETINLPRLIALVAEKADVQPAEARKFLHELFAAIESALLEGESVKIKGVGEFIRGEDPESPVRFKADDDLAAIANEPFAAFEAVELNEGAAEEIMKVEAAASAVPVTSSAEETAHGDLSEPEAVDKPKPEIADEIIEDADMSTEPDMENPDDEPADIEPDESPEGESTDELEPEKEHPANPVEEPEVCRQSGEPDEAQERVVYVQAQSNHGMWLMLGILIGLIAGLVGGYFAGKYMAQYELPAEEDLVFDEDTLSVVSIVNSPADTVMNVDTISAIQAVATVSEHTSEAPAPKKSEPVYDTVSSKRYLAIIAGEHYGVKNYWIFIYNANPNLGDPNKIAPGTKVLVPEKDSFMEDSKAETDAKARRLLNELSKKYKL